MAAISPASRSTKPRGSRASMSLDLGIKNFRNVAPFLTDRAKGDKPRVSPRARAKAADTTRSPRTCPDFATAWSPAGLRPFEHRAFRLDLVPAEAALDMIVDQPHRLHERIARRRPDEAEAALAQILGKRA